MKITVLSDNQACHYTPKESSALIRIYQTNVNELSDMGSRIDGYSDCFVYRLPDVSFEELFTTHRQQLSDLGVDAVTQEDRNTLYEFLEKNKDVQELVIHCAMGISRSPALSIVVTWFYSDTNKEKELIRYLSGKTFPSSYLLNDFAKDLNVRRNYLGYRSEEQFEKYLEELHCFGTMNPTKNEVTL